VFARGVDRRAVFFDDDDRRDYLAILGDVVDRMRWHCLAYCLMDNHVHLLIEIDQPNLGRGIQRLHGLYGTTFNERHGRTGHVFQGRYGSTLMTSDAQLWWTISYIAHNPVKAGLCASPAQWQWGSHRCVLEGGAPPWLSIERLLMAFGGLDGDPRRHYAQLTV
jgi:putative transposase